MNELFCDVSSGMMLPGGNFFKAWKFEWDFFWEKEMLAEANIMIYIPQQQGEMA